MKLFKREEQDTYALLDALMVRMASDKTYDEYIILRGAMQWETDSHSV